MTENVMKLLAEVEERQARTNQSAKYLERGFNLFGSEFINPKTGEVFKSGENLEYLLQNAPEFKAPNLYTDDMTGITYFEGNELGPKSRLAIQRTAETYAYKLTLGEAGTVIELLQGENIINVWTDKLKVIAKKWDGQERLNGLGVKYYNTPNNIYNRFVFKFWLNGVVHNLTKTTDTAPFPFSLDIISETQGIGKTTFFANINKVLTGKSFPTNISFNSEDKFALGRMAISPLVIDDEFIASNAVAHNRGIKDPNASIKQFITLENVQLERKNKEAISTQRRYTVGRTTNDRAVYTDLSTGYERRYLPVQPNLELFGIKLPIDDTDGFYTQLLAEAVVKYNDFNGYGFSEIETKQVLSYKLPERVAQFIQEAQADNKLIDIATEHATEILHGLHFDKDIFANGNGSASVLKALERAYNSQTKTDGVTLVDMPNIHVSPISEFISSTWPSAGSPQSISRRVKKVLSAEGYKEKSVILYDGAKTVTRVMHNDRVKPVEANIEAVGGVFFE